MHTNLQPLINRQKPDNTQLSLIPNNISRIWQTESIKMDDWAKVVTEEGKIIYINPTAGKFVHEVDKASIMNWEEFKSIEKECDKKKKKKN